MRLTNNKMPDLKYRS